MVERLVSLLTLDDTATIACCGCRREVYCLTAAVWLEYTTISWVTGAALCKSRSKTGPVLRAAAAINNQRHGDVFTVPLSVSVLT